MMYAISDLSRFAQASAAAYAVELIPLTNNTVRYVDPKVGMSLAQAQAFNSAWNVLDQFGIRLLEGVRGDAPADLGLLADVLGRLAALAERFPAIVEIDVNPFLAADAAGSLAVDARVRVAP